MGLDMYLMRKTYIWQDEGKTNLSITGYDVLEKKEYDFRPNTVKYVIEEQGYWRKANHIHSWFVMNVQDGKDDCGEYYVTDDELKSLLGAVNEVLDDNTKAEELLPTQSGFFFGSTEYDDYYFQDLELTKKIVEDALSRGGEYYYHSSW